MTERCITDFWRLSENSYCASDTGDAMFKIPEVMGKGQFRIVSLYSGIKVAVFNYSVKEKTTHRVVQYDPTFGLNFSLSGHIRMVSNNKDHSIKPMHCGIFYHPDRTTTVEEFPDEPILRVLVQIPPDLWSTLMEKDFHLFPSDFRTATGKGAGNGVNRTDKLTAPMVKILRQIIHCPYHGAVRQLFIEGKVMELMAHKLFHMTQDRKTEDNPDFLNSGLIDKIRSAGDLLSEEYQNPPNLQELSQFLGLSRNKLLNSFKRVYGTTPAGFIRDRRFEKAGAILEEGEMNVTETANFVGYSNLSHFALAFKKYYGTSPGTWYQYLSS